VFDKIKEERDAHIAMMKFQSDLKLQDKLDNVERVARVNEFRRLQTLQKIQAQDMKYEDIQYKKTDLSKRHNEEAKHSLIRKHEISDAMEKMRMTNDYTLLDKLFDSKKNKRDKKEDKHDVEGEDPRLAQTI
jgi:acetolactate synthase regulatory subunit